MGALGRAGAAVSVASAVANLLGYLVPLLAARTMEAADVGAVASIMAILSIVAVPGLGLQIAIAVAVAKHGAVDRIGRLTTVVAALTVLPLLPLTPVLASALSLPWQAVPLTALIAGLVIVGFGRIGVLQGNLKFGGVAVGLALIGLARTGGIIIGLIAGMSLTNMLLLGVVIAALAIAPLLRLTAPSAPTPGLIRAVWAATSATLAFFLLSYADLIAARYLLTGQASGEYAVLSVLTKGAIWAPQMFAIVALPFFARNVRGSRLLAGGGVAAVGGILVVASVLFGPLALRLAGGPAYEHLAGYAPWFAAIGSVYALVLVLTNSQLASGATAPAAPLWVGFIAFVAGVLFVAPATITGIVSTALIVATLVLAATMVLMNRARAAAPAQPVPPQ